MGNFNEEEYLKGLINEYDKNNEDPLEELRRMIKETKVFFFF